MSANNQNNTSCCEDLPSIQRSFEEIWNDPIFQQAFNDLINIVDEIVRNQNI